MENLVLETYDNHPGLGRRSLDLFHPLGNKFEVRFGTQRNKADGKAMLYDFDVEVRIESFDLTCLVDEPSGGQFVMVTEAINLGIAISNMPHGEGICYDTPLHGEAAGDRDAANSKECVRMLRRAIDLGGYHLVMFICHTPLVLDLADSIPGVGGGCAVMGHRQEASTE